MTTLKLNPKGQSIHTVKCWPGFFADHASGAMPFTVRLNDRDYRRGDWIRMREYHPGEAPPHDSAYTGRDLLFEITTVAGPEVFADVFGITDNVVVLGIRPVQPAKPLEDDVREDDEGLDAIERADRMQEIHRRADEASDRGKTV